MGMGYCNKNQTLQQSNTQTIQPPKRVGTTAETAPVTEEKEEVLTGRAAVMSHLSRAQEALTASYRAGVQANVMAADLPAFQRIQGLAKEVSALMAEVSKVRGL